MSDKNHNEENGNGGNPGKKRTSRKKRKPSALYSGIIAIVLCFAIIIGGTVYLIDKYMPNFKSVPLYTYYDFWEEGSLQIISHDDPLSEPEFQAVEIDGEVYLSYEFVKKYIDKYAFWDEAENTMILTTALTVLRFPVPGVSYYENGAERKLDLSFHTENNQVYIPISFLTGRYNVEIRLDDEYRTVIVDNKEQRQSISSIKTKKSVMRYEPDIKSPIEDKLVKGDILAVYEAVEGFTKVRTQQGLVGYVRTSDLDDIQIIEPVTVSEPQITYAKPLDGKITLLWDQETNVDASSEPLRRQTIDGVDVLSPTWFSFDAEKLNGNIISIADKSYVEFAHSNGYQVWALITDNFNGDVCHSVVSSSSVREHVISQLVGYVTEYKLDGINIDFEMVRKDDAACYLQFIRELAPALRQHGAYLSVDMFVPSPWSMYYNRAEVGKAADFICIMAYDEHYSGSPVSGPVASLNFVDSGVADTLEEVPKEKILMGMPFYVRVWREERDEPDGSAKLTIKNYSMEYAYDLFKQNKAEFIWLAEIGSFYAEYHATEAEKLITYKVWLEDEYSIEQKLKIASKYDVAGVACWKRGLEKEMIWALINQYVN